MGKQQTLLTLRLLLIGFLAHGIGWSQTDKISFEPEDRDIFKQIIYELPPEESIEIGQAVAATGKLLLNTPYEAGTLEIENQERLIVNLRGLDCTTFVENALAIGGMARNGQKDWDTYLKHLEQLRYRDGILMGYPSRLHYFTDWIRDNSEKGLVLDITEGLGGLPVQKKINFMGSHPELYPALASEKNLERIRENEAELSAEDFFVLPAESVSKVEDQIRDGDIIALATSVEGLDVTHTGLALRKADGRIHLLHASTRGAVEVSKVPLSDYLKGIKGNTGIIVIRPLDFQE